MRAALRAHVGKLILGKLALLTLGVGFATFARGCVSPCVAACENGQDNGCFTSGDCGAYCDAESDRAQAAGCENEFDSYNDCASGLDNICVPGECDAELRAYYDCYPAQPQ